MSLVLKKIDTVELKVEIAIPPENPVIKGFITCDAVVRSKAEMKALSEKLEEGEFTSDAELLTKGDLYRDIRGLTNTDGKELKTFEDALQEVTEGKYSVYLTTALVRKYFGHTQDAQSKNSIRSRGR